MAKKFKSMYKLLIISYLVLFTTCTSSKREDNIKFKIDSTKKAVLDSSDKTRYYDNSFDHFYSSLTSNCNIERKWDFKLKQNEDSYHKQAHFITEGLDYQYEESPTGIENKHLIIFQNQKINLKDLKYENTDTYVGNFFIPDFKSHYFFELNNQKFLVISGSIKDCSYPTCIFSIYLLFDFHRNKVLAFYNHGRKVDMIFCDFNHDNRLDFADFEYDSEKKPPRATYYDNEILYVKVWSQNQDGRFEKQKDERGKEYYIKTKFEGGITKLLNLQIVETHWIQ